MRRTFAALTVALAFVACGDGITIPEGEDARVVAFVDLVNQHRLDVGCGALTWRSDVANVAWAHSADMITRDFFAHTNPDGDSPFDRLNQAGIGYRVAAENIAFGYVTAEAVLQAWLDSPGHRGNIENCAMTQHGVGRVETYWTHVFLSP